MTSAPRWYLPALLLALALLPAPARAQTSAAAAWSASPAAQLKSALRELVAAQARYRETRGGYARTVAPLRLPAELGVRLEVTAASGTGWQARAVHQSRPGRSCVIFVGRVEGVDSPRTEGDGEMAGEDGVPLCDRMR
ncbi:MAG TPA: hypothetical protein VM387_02345 [Gemmatimonadales bacterium]|jgi:hypothetical protein|nr:hypothetical protein [Gemmatimonadales bacterium]